VAARSGRSQGGLNRASRHIGRKRLKTASARHRHGHVRLAGSGRCHLCLPGHSDHFDFRADGDLLLHGAQGMACRHEFFMDGLQRSEGRQEGAGVPQSGAKQAPVFQYLQLKPNSIGRSPRGWGGASRTNEPEHRSPLCIDSRILLIQLKVGEEQKADQSNAN
jgi:hypothetical protein